MSQISYTTEETSSQNIKKEDGAMITVYTEDKRYYSNFNIKTFNEDNGFSDELISYIKAHKHKLLHVSGYGWAFLNNEVPDLLDLINDKKALYQRISEKVNNEGNFRKRETAQEREEYYRRLAASEEKL